MKNTFPIHLLFICSTLTLSVCAQVHTQKLTPKEQLHVVSTIGELLREKYIFPEVAEEMAEFINTSLTSQYWSIEWPQEFAECITQDLRAISNDRHLRVIYDPKAAKERNVTTSSKDRSEAFENYLENLRKDNYGFKELNILEGNIGYLNLKGFINTDYARETAVAAMNFLANSDAVIIDLRENGGGSPTMIQLVSSYFFKDEPIHLNTFYNRYRNETWETWTLADVPGKRMPDVDLYILTSNYTFSAAEEFAYNLRNLSRATIIGETTGGGAHPVERLVISDGFMISLPVGRAINPVTNTNWEGVGVEPHVKVDKDGALLTAHIQALEKLLSKAGTEKKKFYEGHLANIKSTR